jgi:hypothetical protein
MDRARAIDQMTGITTVIYTKKISSLGRYK